MLKKAYVAPDGKTIQFTNLVLTSDDGSKAFQKSGLHSFKDMMKDEAVKEYLETHLRKEIKVETNSYELDGSGDSTRPATAEEITIIMDEDFPDSELYSQDLWPINNSDNYKHPNGFTIKVNSLEEIDNQLKVIDSEETVKFKIKSPMGKEYELIPKLFLVEVEDFMMQKHHNLGLKFVYTDGEWEDYFTLNFGEYIGMKNTAYIDTNNCWYANQIYQTFIASNTGLTKRSGYCEYPLWQFREEFLKAVGEEIYQKYSDEYDNYMKEALGMEEPCEEPTMEM